MDRPSESRSEDCLWAGYVGAPPDFGSLPVSLLRRRGSGRLIPNDLICIGNEVSLPTTTTTTTGVVKMNVARGAEGRMECELDLLH